MDEAKKQCAFSVICSVVGWVMVAAGVGIAVGITLYLIHEGDVDPTFSPDLAN